MTDPEVIKTLRMRIAEGKLLHSDLVHYLNRSSQMVSMLLSGKRKWQRHDIEAARALLNKFVVIG